MENADLLRNAGFTENEIQQFDEAPNFPQDSLIGHPAWMTMIENRQEWVRDKIQRGWQKDEIENEIMNYYLRDLQRTPFDFLKAEYKPPKKHDYMDMIRKRHEVQISGDIQDYYEKKQRKYNR